VTGTVDRPTGSAGRRLLAVAAANRRPRSLHKPAWWARSSGGRNPALDLSPLVAGLVVFAVLAYSVASAWSGNAPAAVEGTANAFLVAVVWSTAAPAVTVGWAARRCAWLAVAAASVPAWVPVTRHPGLLEHGGVLGAGVVALAGVAMTVAQYRVAARAPRMRLASPFVDGRWGVIQGGARCTNVHARSASQRLALDLVKIRMLGPRLHGLIAHRLGDYLSYGATLVSPVDGTVVTARDGIDDQTGLRWPPQGNLVVIEPDDRPGFRVALCHLRYGRVLVVAGQRVQVGQPIGQVGSSGNSTEPHLHLQVNDEHGDPVAICIGRRRPMRRNDVVRGRLVRAAPGSAQTAEDGSTLAG